MSNPQLSNPGTGRKFIAATGAVVATIIWTHAVAAILRPLGPDGAPLASLPLTVAAVLVALVGAASWPRRWAVAAAFAAAALAASALEILYPGSGTAALALVLVGPVVTWAGGVFASRLPASLDTAHTRNRLVSALWVLLALAAVVQTGRLTTYMADPEFDWYLTTRHPFWAKHECMTAYFYGAELSERGVENLYDAVHYPGLNPEAEVATTMVGMTPEDPYQYTPQFLLLPRLAMSVTRDYTTIRLLWFALQATFFIGVAGWLAAWVGGRTGRVAAALLPLAFIAFPTLHNFQYGQIHLSAIALAVGGYLAFESRRRALGGAMLAVAILAKIFPGVMLLPLAVQRRWKDLGWTLGFVLALTLVGLIVLGPAPYRAFFDYHLPRLASGEAFAFDVAWPEIRELVIADNQGAYGLAVKLSELGVPGLTAATTRWIARLFGIAVIVLTVLVSCRRTDGVRRHRAVTWLAILGLASMVSTGAWGDYVPVASIWLLTLVAVQMNDSIRLLALLTACWIFQFFILGTTPIGQWAPPQLMIPLSAVGVVLMLWLYTWAMLARRQQLQPTR